jgi:hypothetical protein
VHFAVSVNQRAPDRLTKTDGHSIAYLAVLLSGVPREPEFARELLYQGIFLDA